MAPATEKIYEWDKHPWMPVPPPPTGSCECQFHIYDEPAKFPPRPNPQYPAIASANFAEAQKMHKAIGFDHGNWNAPAFEVQKAGGIFPGLFFPCRRVALTIAAGRNRRQ